MNKELDFTRPMFDSIAHRYDFLNRLLSLRQDVYWRKEMVRAAELHENCHVLDVACGTCDVGIEIQKQHREQYGTDCKIFGVDFSHTMLLFAKKKNIAAIDLAAGNALLLPFKKKMFDTLFIAFGIRNIMDRAGALKEFRKCLKNSGRLVVLELTTPRPGVLKNLYILYFKKILPRLGAFFSKNKNAYTYLPESVLKFPEPRKFVQIMKDAGFTDVRYKTMTLGIVTLFTGKKQE